MDHSGSCSGWNPDPGSVGISALEGKNRTVSSMAGKTANGSV